MRICEVASGKKSKLLKKQSSKNKTIVQHSTRALTSYLWIMLPQSNKMRTTMKLY